MENPTGSCSSLGRRNRIKKKVSASLFDESFIVDDLIVDILSRLSAKDVLLCRCVCRRWRDLTSTSGFTDLHFRCSSQMILKEHNGRALLDRCWEPSRTRSKIHKLYEPRQNGIRFSHNGLIVAYGVGTQTNFVIYNPIYRDCDSVCINVPLKSCYSSEVYGVYFNPVQNEYCSLWRRTLSYKPWKIQYKILNLGSNPKGREIRNPCTQQARMRHICPLLVDKYIYWMVDPSELHDDYNESTFNCDIMEFDICKEEFRLIPCPVPVSVKRYSYNANPIDIDGVISLVQVFPSKESVQINIWVLNNDGEQLWTCSNYIVCSDLYPGYGVPKAIAFRNGELVLQSDGRLYVCNLKLGTCRKFGQKYHHDVKFLPHVMSLGSLKNCKSFICEEEVVEINHRNRGRGEEIQALR